MDTVALITADELGTVRWSTHPTAVLAQQWIVPIMQQGVANFISNVHAQIYLLQVNEKILPLTISGSYINDSYIVSPYCYIPYSLEEIRHISNSALRFVLRCIVRGVGVFLRHAKINETVMVNNWLVSTNLYPDLSQSEIRSVTTFLKDRFPQKVIVWRSLNDAQHTNLLSNFAHEGYKRIASRQVYIFNPAHQQTLTSAMKTSLRGDAHLARTTHYRCTYSCAAQSAKRLESLYRMLYVEKYSVFNPQYTEAFFSLAIERKFISFIFLEDKSIDAMAGYWSIGSTFSTPMVGYDTSKPKEKGLYRLLTHYLLRHMEDTNMVMNHSSGVGAFKRYRGGMASIEYSAVYVRHLPWQRRLPWFIFGTMLNMIGVPLIKAYKL